MIYFPTHLNIETSDACNRRCGFCPVPRAPRGAPPRRLDLGLFRRLHTELAAAPGPLKVALHWGDEPLANARLLDYAELGRELLPEARWLLQTNGLALTRELTRELERLFDAVVINLYDGASERHLEALELDVAQAVGPGRIQQPGRLERPPGPEGRRPGAIFHVNRKLGREDWLERPRQPDGHAPPCTHPWRDAAIDPDGQVYLCCRDSQRAHPVGNLAESSLLDCYNSAAAQALRAVMQGGRRDTIGMCRTCPVVHQRPFDVLTPPEVDRLAAAAGRPATGARTVTGAWARIRADPGALAAWAPGQMPWGRYDYLTARNLARELGHVPLPGFLPERYEYVVGLTPEVARGIVAVVRERVGRALRAIWICGGRVMTREHLWWMEPAVFAGGRGGGTLSPRRLSRLREMGRDVRLSSDLDLKILVSDGAFDAEARDAIERELGERLEGMSRFMPLSGHRQPRHRLWAVEREIVDPRLAFTDYNRRRPTLMGKGPLPVQGAVLLWGGASWADPLAADPRAAVLGRLRRRREGARQVALAGLALPKTVAAMGEGRRWRSTFGGLSGHQWVGALSDFPDHEAPGVRLGARGEVRAGGLVVWAANIAGRETIEVR